MTEYRTSLIEDSNNPDNPNKNLCTLAVCEELGVADNVRYLHTISDVERAIKKSYRLKDLTYDYLDFTISNSRSHLTKYAKEHNVMAYYVFLFDDGEGHMILLNHNGKTAVDTMEKFNGYDSRRIGRIAAIF